MIFGHPGGSGRSLPILSTPINVHFDTCFLQGCVFVVFPDARFLICLSFVMPAGFISALMLRLFLASWVFEKKKQFEVL